VHPEIRAGAHFMAATICGPFHGTMAATTPIGSCSMTISEA
jgi:hypothetical protein